MGAVATLFALLFAASPEGHCRAEWARVGDFDVEECTGLNYWQATRPPVHNRLCAGDFRYVSAAACCQTPTAWVEQDAYNEDFWFAVCGTADGRVCGVDVQWGDPACE